MTFLRNFQINSKLYKIEHYKFVINLDTLNLMHRSANLAPLYKRRLCHVYNFMYKQQINVYRLDIRQIFTRRRDANIFTTKHPTCEKYKKNVYYFGAMNDLQVKTRLIETYDQFKNFQKKQMLL